MVTTDVNHHLVLVFIIDCPLGRHLLRLGPCILVLEHEIHAVALAACLPMPPAPAPGRGPLLPLAAGGVMPLLLPRTLPLGLLRGLRPLGTLLVAVAPPMSLLLLLLSRVELVLL